MLAPGSHDVTILPEQSDCTGLDPDLGPRFRGFLREIAVEQGPLEDISALVPGPGLVDDQRASVGRDHAGAIDLMADEFLRRREADFLQPSLRDPLPASDRGPDLRALLDEEDLRPSLGRVLRGRAAGRPRPDDEHVHLLVHDVVRISTGLMSLLGVWPPFRTLGGIRPSTLEPEKCSPAVTRVRIQVR